VSYEKTIFYDDLDRKKFLEQLIDSLNTYEAILHSYTLMYIHLNIVRAQGTELTLYDEKWNLLHNYKWSSLPGYLNKSKTKPFVNYDFILSVINGRRAYKQYISDALQKGTRNPFEQQLYGCILGNKTFIDKIRKEHTFEGSTREQPT